MPAITPEFPSSVPPASQFAFRGRSGSSSKGSSSFARWGILILALIALALGGGTELWEQTALITLAAFLMFISPPRRSPGAVFWILGAALLLLAFAAFFPAAWFPMPPWRHHLAGNASIQLPFTRTPQPALTLQACGFLFAGLAWAGYVLGHSWDRRTRFRAAQVLVLGVAVLAVAMTGAFFLHFHVPFWKQEANRGWFPNRNQTADVLALCGVINYALVSGSLRKKRLVTALWVVTLLCIGLALIVSYSRAGILMFFSGAALWHLWPSRNRLRRGRHTVKWAVLSLTLVLVLLTGFFLFGGDTLARFQGRPGSRPEAEFRVAIQRDALHFSLQSPVFGVGLGNFEALFATAQRKSANEDRAIHPESDWLWAACEMGWPAVLLMAAGVVWWVRRCLPFRSRPGESLRRAFVVSGILFVLHGLVDVSGHRLGSLWIGLLVAALALPRVSRRGTALRRRAERRRQAWIFRGLALGLLVVTGWWAASIQGAAVPPTTATLARMEDQISAEMAANELLEMQARADNAVRIAPVNWHLYFQRAYAEAFLPGQMERAGSDFLAARLLEGRWVQPCLDEGQTWLAANEPDLCLDAWTEALRRALPSPAGQASGQAPTSSPNSSVRDAFRWMVGQGHDQPQVRDGLMQLAAGHPELQVIFLDYADPDEMKQVLGDILAADPGLNHLDSDQRLELFQDWWIHGDRPQFLQQLGLHPEWISTAWPLLAESYAAQNDYQQAWQTVARYSSPPRLPQPGTGLSSSELEATFHEDDNVAAGIMLFLIQDQQGSSDAALGTLLALEKLKDCPKYIFYEEARLWAAKQQWELAWMAWKNYTRK